MRQWHSLSMVLAMVSGGDKSFLLRDILPGPEGSEPRLLTNVDSVLFFTADDGVRGRELWKSDGTSSGTFRVGDFIPGPGLPRSARAHQAE